MNSNKIIFITLITLLALISFRIAGWTIINKTELWQGVTQDEFHHYHIGFILLVISFISWKRSSNLRELSLAIGSGLIIDEWIYVFKFFNPELFSHFHATYTPIKFIFGLVAEFLAFAAFSVIILKIGNKKAYE